MADYMGFEHVCPRERRDPSTLIALAETGHMVRTDAQEMCSCTLDRKGWHWRGDSPTNDHTCPYVSQTQLHSESCPQENCVVDAHHTLFSSNRRSWRKASWISKPRPLSSPAGTNTVTDMYDVLPAAGQWLITLLEQRTELTCSLIGGK